LITRAAIGPSALADPLRDSEQRCCAIRETSLRGKIVHRRFRPFFANPVAANRFGYASLEPLLGASAVLAVLNDDSRQAPESAWRRLRGGQSVVGRRTLRRVTGEPLRADVFVCCLDWHGEPGAAIAVADVAREERTQRAQPAQRDAQILAESAARAKKRFLAGASHDMRTPLHGAMGRLREPSQARPVVREGRVPAKRWRRARGSCILSMTFAIVRRWSRAPTRS
jgi:signal transduction histidine kinase